MNLWIVIPLAVIAEASLLYVVYLLGWMDGYERAKQRNPNKGVEALHERTRQH